MLSLLCRHIQIEVRGHRLLSLQRRHICGVWGLRVFGLQRCIRALLSFITVFRCGPKL